MIYVIENFAGCLNKKADREFYGNYTFVLSDIEIRVLYSELLKGDHGEYRLVKDFG